MMNNETLNKRVLWIDYAKALGIFLVVVGHCYFPVEGFDLFSKNFIYSFHMPIFFFISGFLFRIKEKSFGKFLRKSITNLIIPYILLNLLAAVLFTPIIIKQGFEAIFERLFDFAVGGGHSFAGASWFLIAMFWIRLFAFMSLKYEKIVLSIVCSFLVAYLFQKPCYFDFTAAAAAYPMFMLGVLCKSKKLLVPIENFRYISFIISFVLLVISCYFMKGVSIYSLSFGEYPFAYFPYSILGGVFFISLSMILAKSNNSIISNISRGSIIIMCLHGVISMYVEIMLSRIIAIDQNTLLYSLFCSVISVIILYFPMKLILSKFPIFTGGR